MLLKNFEAGTQIQVVRLIDYAGDSGDSQGMDIGSSLVFMDRDWKLLQQGRTIWICL